MLLADRTVVVSGVGAGLGHEVAAACVREGARVVLGARTEANLAKCAAEIDPEGRCSAYRAVDIRDEQQCEALAALARERFGGIDAVVHVAAMDMVMGGLEGADLAEWQQVIDVNLLGTLRMTRACLPALKEAGARGDGSVVMIGTQSSVVPPSQIQQTAYAASKGGLVSAMYSLARELGPHRIRVNTVQPGWMWGPMVEGYVAWTADTEGVGQETVRARLDERMALPRMASDGDVAETVAFFASARARGVTGQCLLVNAGEVMR
ncbi:SDR family oxidoreductase [Streptomyces sp. NBC_01186]|uniref:SDR family oxidoreductase n=1 Tax=unclassified Streptomyces TaxID=2593676 RepID=UPI002DD8B060|nr:MULTISPECIES: SDR family oxidoreductase [unclassified Streptomyces]WSB78528.1 SDR family oxidoreductase [Streptomyces sp. NBC_01775]WSS13272.1 SDR family oxidoreductase [Streptomyces sp. NBC_01186]